MEDVENVIKKLSDVSAMLFQMYKDETDKENISIRYDQFLAVDNALELLKEQKQKIDVLEDQNARLIRQKEAGFQQKWIPVSEALPKSMANKVLVYLDHEDLVGYIGFGHYEKFQGEEMWYDLEYNEQFSKRGYTVTHWMPLPEQPKDETH